MGGILTILSGMFVILVTGIIHRRDEAGGGRTDCGESDNVCAVRDVSYECHKLEMPCVNRIPPFIHLKR